MNEKDIEIDSVYTVPDGCVKTNIALYKGCALIGLYNYDRVSLGFSEFYIFALLNQSSIPTGKIIFMSDLSQVRKLEKRVEYTYLGLSNFCRKLVELGFEFYISEEMIHPKLLKLTFDKINPNILKIAQKYFDSMKKGKVLDNIRIVQINQDFNENTLTIKEGI